MRNFFIILSSVLVSCMGVAFAQNNIDAKEYLSNLERKKIEFSKKSTYDLGVEYRRVREKLREEQKKSPGSIINPVSDDMALSVAVVSILEQRRNAGDKEAIFQYAMTQLPICERLLSVKKEYGEKSCNEVERDLRAIATTDNRAMSVLAVMYEEGVWFEKSNFAAADWHLKLAEYYEKIGKREEMLISLEKALKLNPDFRRAKEFMNRVM